MNKSCVTISLVPQAKGGPFVFWNDLAGACGKAADLGFDAVEIFPTSPDALRAESVGVLLDKHHLGLAAVGTGGGWAVHKWHLTHADPAIRAKAREFIREMISAAAEFGASTIVGSMQGRFEGEISKEQALDWLREAMNDLGEHARTLGQTLFYEPLNRYETNILNRAAETVDFLSALSTKNVKALADLFHMNIEEGSIVEGLRAYGPYLGHLHFVDSNRRAAGGGHIDFGAVARVLREISYRGYISAEALPYPSSDEAAKRTMEMFKRFFPQGQ